METGKSSGHQSDRKRELFEAAEALAGSRLDAFEPCAGGDINQAYKLSFADGTDAFLKTRPGAPVREFEAEAAGLEWLAEPGALPVPAVLGVVEGEQPGLMLEWLEPGGRLDAAGEAELGAGLARIHRSGAEAFGGTADGAPATEVRVGPIGLGPEADVESERGFGPCYARRLTGLVAQAIDRAAIDPVGAAAIERLCEEIERFAGPPEPPARTHGDLWSGNVLVTADGRPWLIDPAAHGAHRELDLAMLSLFGAPSDRFFGAYREEFPLASEHQERVELWQIQPLLIHAILFGGSYGTAAARAAGKYI